MDNRDVKIFTDFLGLKISKLMAKETILLDKIAKLTENFNTINIDKLNEIYNEIKNIHYTINQLRCLIFQCNNKFQ